MHGPYPESRRGPTLAPRFYRGPMRVLEPWSDRCIYGLCFNARVWSIVHGPLENKYSRSPTRFILTAIILEVVEVDQRSPSSSARENPTAVAL